MKTLGNSIFPHPLILVPVNVFFNPKTEFFCYTVVIILGAIPDGNHSITPGIPLV